MASMTGTVLLVFTLALCAVTALAAFARPAPFAALLGLTVANAGGANEVRSQYAGFFLLVGAAAGAALLGAVPRPAAYLLMLVVFGGLALGRIVSLLLNRGFGGFTPAIRALYGVDLLGCTLSLIALHAQPLN